MIILLKTLLPAKETKLRKKGRIWRKRKKLVIEKKGNLEKFGRSGKIDKIWNLDFVSLNARALVKNLTQTVV